MFEGKVILIAGLVEFEMPDRTVRLCDGGFVDWPARGMFTSKDDDYGTIESVEAVSEAISDEAPAGRLTLLPAVTAAAADLFHPTAQGRPIKFWLAEVDRETGLLIGDPELVFSGFIDFMTLKFSKNDRKVEIEFISSAEKLFFIREGNVLSDAFHQQAWPGELGFTRCTGTQVAVPWGVSGPGRGTSFWGNLFGLARDTRAANASVGG